MQRDITSRVWWKGNMRKMLLVLIVIVVVFGALYYINLQLFQEMLRQQAEDEFGGEASVPKYQSDCVV